MPRIAQRTYSKAAEEAALLLGQFIKLGRKERRLSAAALAERIGVSRGTVQRIEKGDLKVEIGLVLEAANIVGVPLFDTSDERLSSKLESTANKIALLPKKLRKPRHEVNDDF